MSEVVALLVLAVLTLGGLVLVPFGLPGLWVMVLGIVGYGWLTDFRSVTIGLIAVVLGLALAGELLEWWLGFSVAQRYGGSRRTGWAALVGGLVGAAVGVPVPLIGSVVGGFVGAFVAATLAEYARVRRAPQAVQAGWGALVGRTAATAAKLGCGVVIVVLAVYAAWPR
jgi:uncharacterized protein YqgC (DUF456 family)